MDVKTWRSRLWAFGIIPGRFVTASTVSTSTFHLRMLPPERFAALREFFSRSGFTEGTIRSRLEIPQEKPLDLVNIATGPFRNRNAADSLDALLYLFVLGEALPVAQATSFFPSAVWEGLLESELVLVEAKEAGQCLASAALFPVRDLFLAADRWTNIDHSLRPTFTDIVYPVMTKSGKQYLDFLPVAACGDFLELCAGTAPAALLAAKNAKQSWATDITERSLAYARFNAALNGIENVTFARGDLFGAVPGRAFDRIAAHPPYMPVLKPAEIYSAGGALGDEIARRIIAELPGKLKPGGRLYCRTLGMDRGGSSFEHQVRQWLGEKNGKHDVALFVFDVLQPRRFALEHTLNRDGGREQLTQWEKIFAENGVKELLALILVIQCVDGQRPAFTLRRLMHETTTSAVVEWALRWETFMHSPGRTQALLAAKPLATPGTEATARHVFRNGELAPEDFRISTRQPFEVDWSVQPWMALLLPICDGETTVSELFEKCKANGWIVAETPIEEFCDLVGNFVSGGFLQCRNLKWPEAVG
jgi:SAM-dependent methyltransferase